MFGSFLKIALRSMLKQKTGTLINVVVTPEEMVAIPVVSV